MNGEMFSFDGFLGFRKWFFVVFFCGNPFFISETGSSYFAKCDSKFSKLFKFSELLSVIVQMFHAMQNGIFHLQ